jgi:hypothetical protein
MALESVRFEDLVAGEKYLIRLKQIYVGHVEERVVRFERTVSSYWRQYEFFDSKNDPFYLMTLAEDAGGARWRISMYRIPDVPENSTLAFPETSLTYPGTYCTYFGCWGR